MDKSTTKQACSIEGCERPVLARTYCGKHYQRFRNSDKFFALPKRTLSERFWAKVNKASADKCWVWTGSVSRANYGGMRIAGKGVIATHVSWFLHYGSWPTELGFWVLHKCDNPPCVNPAHLFLGTAQDNTKDMLRKGRSTYAVGVDSNGAKLSEADVHTIRRLYRVNDMSAPELGRMFSVAANTIRSIVRYKTWKHLP